MCGLSESMGTMAWCWEYQVTEVDSKHEVEQTVCRHSAFLLGTTGKVQYSQLTPEVCVYSKQCEVDAAYHLLKKRM